MKARERAPAHSGMTPGSLMYLNADPVSSLLLNQVSVAARPFTRRGNDPVTLARFRGFQAPRIRSE